MKIRNNFISNSSSSSFILFGQKCEFEEMLKSDKDGIWISDDSLNDGCNAVNVTKQFKEYFSKNPKNLPSGTFYVDYELCGMDYKKNIVNKNNVNKDITEVNIDYNADYDDFENFLERI